MDPADEDLRRILEETRTIAVVGISDRTNRASNEVARYLKAAGYRVIPVNPRLAGQTLMGEDVFASLRDLPVSLGPIDMVDIFRRSEHAGEVVDEALDALQHRGLATIWMQLGVVDEEAAGRARSSGVTVVMDRCPKIEHARLFTASA